MKKAKIVATLGPASASQPMVERLAKAGMDVCRLNFSFGTHEEHLARIAVIRAAAAAVGKPLAVMQDLQGPKIRVGALSAPVTVKKGDTLALSGKAEHKDRLVIPTTYQQIAADTEPGKTILLSDGKIILKVLEAAKSRKEVLCKVECGGTILTGKGINLPYTNISLPALTPKDVEDAVFGVKAGVNLMCLSFVRKPDDVRKLRRLLEKEGGSDIQIVCKIEKPEALDNLEAILDESDGVMVARGDLADEISFAKVPVAQKEILRKANRRGKITIIATEMLGSMVEQPLPSRAEASDVANGILDGADCVMLSNETATGKYPVEAVQAMASIISEMEAAYGGDAAFEDIDLPERHHFIAALCEAAAHMSYTLRVEKGIVVLTHTGTTARLLSKFRPECPIYAATFDERLHGRMAILHNVTPILLDRKAFGAEAVTEDILAQICAYLTSRRLARPDDPMIFLTGDKLGPDGWLTNCLKVKTLSGGVPASGPRPAARGR